MYLLPYFVGYESVFEKKAFAGEMEFEELDQFFRECDLYPSQSEIDEAVDVVFQGRVESLKFCFKQN